MLRARRPLRAGESIPRPLSRGCQHATGKNVDPAGWILIRTVRLNHRHRRGPLAASDSELNNTLYRGTIPVWH